MRKGHLAAAGLVLLAAMAFGARPAEAMALPAPAALAGAVDEVALIEKVHCRSVWRCGYYGCGWRRVCWAPPYYSRPYGTYSPYRYYGPPRTYGYYGPPRYYGYYGPPRPYYRPYWGYRPYYYPRPRFYVGPFVYGY